MREIKFRYRLKLISDDWGNYKEGDIDTFFFKLNDENIGLSKFSIDERWEIISCDTWIGLKDKFGNDIYENDIVRWDDASNGKKWRVAIVQINPDIQFKIIRIKCDFEQSAKEGYIFHFGRFIYTDTENHLEVIGNKYHDKYKNLEL